VTLTLVDCRLGLIGAGRWGRNYISTIQELPGVTLGRIASNNPETKDLAPLDCRIDADWRLVAAAKDLQGVIIATPPALHAEMVSLAVRSGIPVLVEKPLTMDLSEAEVLVRMVMLCDGYVLVDHTQLFNPAFVALKRALEQLGAITAINAVAGNAGPIRKDASVLWDWGAHDVAMCLDLMAAVPISVSARRIASVGTSGETIEIVMGFANEVVATINISNIRSEKVRRFNVQCREGEFFFDDLAADKLFLISSRPAQERLAPAMEYSAEKPLSSAVRQFVKDIGAGRPRSDRWQMGLDVVRVLARCQASLEGSDKCG